MASYIHTRNLVGEYVASLATDGATPGDNDPYTDVWTSLTGYFHGSIEGTPAWGGAGTSTSPSHLIFDETASEEVSLGTLVEAGAWSIETWASMPSSASPVLNHPLVSLCDTGSNMLGVIYYTASSDAPGLRLYLDGEYLGGASSTTSVKNDGWKHIVGTFGEDHILRLYVNGSLIDVSDIVAAPVLFSDAAIGSFCGYNSATSSASALIATVRIYNEELTLDVIQKNYNARVLASTQTKIYNKHKRVKHRGVASVDYTSVSS